MKKDPSGYWHSMRIKVGDLPGHPFRGNQYTDGTGSAAEVTGIDDAFHQAVQGAGLKTENLIDAISQGHPVKIEASSEGGAPYSAYGAHAKFEATLPNGHLLQGSVGFRGQYRSGEKTDPYVKAVVTVPDQSHMKEARDYLQRFQKTLYKSVSSQWSPTSNLSVTVEGSGKYHAIHSIRD